MGITPKRRSRQALWMVLAGVLSVLWTACGERSAPGVSAAGDGAARPRIVSLAPALTAILVELGAKDHLVGVTSWCDVAGVAVVGDMKPRPEAVLAAEPDLVVMAQYGSQAPDLAPLSALGLETLSLPLVTLDDMRRATHELGELTGTDGDAVVRRFDEALAAGKAKGRRGVRFLLVYGLEPGFVITTGGGDHISELLGELGGVNAVSGGVTTRLGLERVLELNPDVILHAAPSATLPDSKAALAHWATWPGLSAVARGRVFVFPRDTLARNGPQLAGDIAELVRMLDAAP